MELKKQLSDGCTLITLNVQVFRISYHYIEDKAIAFHEADPIQAEFVVDSIVLEQDNNFE